MSEQSPGEAAYEAETRLHFARIDAEDMAWLHREFPACREYRERAWEYSQELEAAEAAYDTALRAAGGAEAGRQADPGNELEARQADAELAAEAADDAAWDRYADYEATRRTAAGCEPEAEF